MPLILSNDRVLVLFFIILAESEYRSYHYVYDSRRLPIIDIALAGCWLVQLLVIFEHLYLVRGVLGIRAIVNVIGSKELGDDEGVHPSEESPQDNEAGNDFRPEIHQFLEVNGICGLAKHTERHVKDAENNGHFHFDTVYKCKFVFSTSPHWVLAKWIYALVVIPPPGARFSRGGDDGTIG